MIQRIHILGASGSGSTTLGRAFAERLQCPHFDTDDYFWVPTDPPYTKQRERTERAQLLMDDVTAQDAWVVSGSLWARILPGGDMYKKSQAFLAWAASYDEGGVDIRSRRRHGKWLSMLPCPIICFEGAYTIAEHLAVLME